MRLAALELFLSRGFDAVTAAEIAARAGVTERTFFRHFGDKREVLFPVGAGFAKPFVEVLKAAPADSTPLQLVEIVVRAGTVYFTEDRREYTCKRGAVIAATPALQEREFQKLGMLSDLLRDGFQERGIEDPLASVAAFACIGVYRSGYQAWLVPEETRSLRALVDEGLIALRSLLT